MFLDKMTVYLNMLGALVEDRVGNLDNTLSNYKDVGMKN